MAEMAERSFRGACNWRLGVPLRPYIWAYIAQDNPGAATAFVLRLEEQIGTLERYLDRCPLVPENDLLGTSYRHLLFGNYRTIFKSIGPK